MLVREKDEALQGKIASLDDDKASIRAEIKKKAETRLAAMKKQLTTQLEEAETKRKAAVDALEAQKQSEQALHPIATERDDLRKQLRSAQLEVTRVQASKTMAEEKHKAQLSASEEEANKLQSDLSETKQQLSSITQKKDELAEKMESLLQQIESLERSLQEHQLQQETATQQSSKREEKLMSEISSLQAAKADVEQKLSALDDKLFVEVNALQKKLRSAEKKQNRTDEEWRTKLEEMLWTMNTERGKLVEDHSQEMKMRAEREESLGTRLKELTIQTEQLQQQLALIEEEKNREKQRGDVRISELESHSSKTQENTEQVIASVKKEAQNQLRSVMKEHQAALQEKELEIEQRLAEQRQQIMEEANKLQSDLSETQQQLALIEEEKNREKQRGDVRISELESHSSKTQENTEQVIASVKKEAQNQLRSVMKEHQAALQEKELEIEQRLAEQRQQIMEEANISTLLFSVLLFFY